MPRARLKVYPVKLKPQTIESLRIAAALTGRSANSLARDCIEKVFDGLADDAALLLELQGRVQAMEAAEQQEQPT